MKFIATIFLLLLAQASWGTTWDQLTVKELYDSSDVVAYVSIESGEVLYNAEFQCGAKFKSKVIDQLKGAPTKLIEFYGDAWYDGMPIGGRYLLFLRSNNASQIGVVSTNSMAMGHEQEFQEKCGSLRAGYIPIPAYGSIQAKYASPVKDFALIVPRMFIKFPDSITVYDDEHLPHADLYDTKWVKAQDALHYLESLQK